MNPINYFTALLFGTHSTVLGLRRQLSNREAAKRKARRLQQKLSRRRNRR